MAVVSADALLQHMRNQANARINARIKAGQVYITVNGQQVPARVPRLYWNDYAMRFEATSPKGLLLIAPFWDQWRIVDDQYLEDYVTEEHAAERIAEWLEII